jgi:hypothetical protein
MSSTAARTAKITTARPAGLPSQQNGALSQDAEMQFVREILAAGVRSGSVAFTGHDLRTAIATFRQVWRDVAG